MHINVRRIGGCWFFGRQGISTPEGFKLLDDASDEAGRRDVRSLEPEAAL
jgi:hypothetical protein